MIERVTARRGGRELHEREGGPERTSRWIEILWNVPFRIVVAPSPPTTRVPRSIPSANDVVNARVSFAISRGDAFQRSRRRSPRGLDPGTKNQKVYWGHEGIEPSTTRTQSEYHTTRPSGHVCCFLLRYRGRILSPIYKESDACSQFCCEKTFLLYIIWSLRK